MEALPAKGLSNGSCSCAPAVVMAWRVVQASNVAALWAARPRDSHSRSWRRPAILSSVTETVKGLLGCSRIIAEVVRNGATTGGTSAEGAGSSGGWTSIAGWTLDKGKNAPEKLEAGESAGCISAIFSAEKEP